MTHPAEHSNPTIRQQWQEASEMANDQTLPEEGRAAMQRMLDQMERLYPSEQTPASKP